MKHSVISGSVISDIYVIGIQHSVYMEYRFLEVIILVLTVNSFRTSNPLNFGPFCIVRVDREDLNSSTDRTVGIESRR